MNRLLGLSLKFLCLSVPVGTIPAAHGMTGGSGYHIRHQHPAGHHNKSASKASESQKLPAIVSNLVSAATVIKPIPAIAVMPESTKKQTLCAALAAYHEARSEPKLYQNLSASLVYTRAGFKHDASCNILAQPGAFPWAHHSKRQIKPKDAIAWEKAQVIALNAKSNPVKVFYTSTRSSYHHRRGDIIVAENRHIIFYNRQFP